MSEISKIRYMIIPLLALFIPVGASAAYATLSAAPWVPSRKSTRDLLVSLPLPAGSIFLELGCGDGRILFDLAAKYPQCTFIGYEISLPLFLLARIRSISIPNIRIRLRSIYKLSDQPTHIYAFLMPDAYKKLKPILLNLDRGTIIYTNIWPLSTKGHSEPLTTLDGQKLFKTIV